MSTISETFIRGNQAGWGTGSSGQTYNIIDGNPSLHILSNQGQVLTANYVPTAISISGESTVSIENTCQFKQTSGRCGLFWRGFFGTYYEASVEDATGILFLNVHMNENIIPIAQFQLIDYVSNALYSIQVISSSTDIALYAYASTIPQNPQISLLDSSILSIGSFGLYVENYSASATLFQNYNFQFNTSIQSAQNLPPTGWQDYIKSMSLTTGNLTDIVQLNPNAYSASLDALCRGMLSYIALIQQSLQSLVSTVQYTAKVNQIPNLQIAGKGTNPTTTGIATDIELAADQTTYTLQKTILFNSSLFDVYISIDEDSTMNPIIIGPYVSLILDNLLYTNLHVSCAVSIPINSIGGLYIQWFGVLANQSFA